jgi:hypothetical protein
VATPKFGVIYAPTPALDLKFSWGGHSRRPPFTSDIPSSMRLSITRQRLVVADIPVARLHSCFWAATRISSPNGRRPGRHRCFPPAEHRGPVN